MATPSNRKLPADPAPVPAQVGMPVKFTAALIINTRTYVAGETAEADDSVAEWRSAVKNHCGSYEDAVSLKPEHAHIRMFPAFLEPAPEVAEVPKAAPNTEGLEALGTPPPVA